MTNDPFTNSVILSASKSFASANDLLKSKDPYNLHRTLQQEGIPANASGEKTCPTPTNPAG